MSAEKPTGLAVLRIPFSENEISKLPKPTIDNAQWKLLPKSRCPDCTHFETTDWYTAWSTPALAGGSLSVHGGAVQVCQATSASSRKTRRRRRSPNFPP